MWRRYVLALWVAFIARGAIHAVLAPMWDGYDEPFHLAYVQFVADHGRPPGFTEPSFPKYILDTNRFLPSAVKYGAPSFVEWRHLKKEDKRQRRHELHNATAKMPASVRMSYMSPNYERQQGPLYYFVVAPVAKLFHNASLPVLLVILRIASVLLASCMIPAAAYLLRLVLPRSGAAIALPLVAFLPNTLFYAFRLSNEALAWPLMALCAIAAARPHKYAGVLLSLGTWTKLTLLAAWTGVAAGAFASKRFVRTFALPVITIAILFAWNRVSSGTYTGLAEATGRKNATLDDWLFGLKSVFRIDWWRRLFEYHVWAGGWGFVRPPLWVLDAILVFVLVIIVALLFLPKQRRLRAPRRRLPLAIIAVTMLAALVVHGVTAAIAAHQSPGLPQFGAEGWYLDAIRPIEVALFAALLFTRLPRRAFGFARIACFALPLVADIAGTTSLLLPHWSGGWPLTWDYSPLPNAPIIAAALTVLFALSCGAAAALGRRDLARGRRPRAAAAPQD
ncbi:MAG: hypothetical protein DMF56_16770 [Acidobacteria bacterium]|nr:MAG: hypothetical protein DMF56_16770 [Acidobacteriota bacterium]